MSAQLRLAREDVHLLVGTSQADEAYSPREGKRAVGLATVADRSGDREEEFHVVSVDRGDNQVT